MDGLKLLQDKYPKIFQCASLLYIGADPVHWTEFLDIFKMGAWNTNAMVLELNPEHVKKLQELKVNVIEGDVRNIETLFGRKKFETIIWEDGPEHIPNSEYDNVIPQLINTASKFVVMEAPDGKYGHPESGQELIL
jgi:hypothetical protein